jgi:hypothetical protein
MNGFPMDLGSAGAEGIFTAEAQRIAEAGLCLKGAKDEWFEWCHPNRREAENQISH